MNRCVILCGAPIGAYEKLRTLLRADDFVIACDSGLSHCEALHLTPNLILGDFDSHEKPETAIETITLPREKDDTDSMYAVREGIRRGFTEFLLLGALGARMDHSLVNLYALLYLLRRGCHGVIADDYSEMELFSGEITVPDSYPYFSLLNITGDAEGLTIEGAKYCLHDAALSCEYPYATSNEVIPGQTARISLRSGCLLLIKDR